MSDSILQYEHITNDDQLEDFCQRARSSNIIGFDTEFVSENRYRPELCLIQAATDDEIAVIDTLAIRDPMPFWKLLVEGDHVTIAHAAREEFLFCFRACQGRPKNLFDIQLAAGMVGMEYPASYGNLISRLMGENIDKGETRTDWRRRPLSSRQMNYAVQDVVYLERMRNVLLEQLTQLGRVDWLIQETNIWMNHLERTETEPQWRRVAGISSLSRAALAVVKEVWIWRNEEARARNRSPKRILPDDLIVALAKRGTSDIAGMKAIRGMENRISPGALRPISAAIQRALDLPSDQYPAKMPRAKTMNLGLLGQFLTTALNTVCKTSKIAPGLVATSQDLRQLAAWKLGMVKLEEKPDLAKGWRAEIVGQTIEKILNGEAAIRVQNPKSDQPLMITPVNKS